jgi:hypothetical protein
MPTCAVYTASSARACRLSIVPRVGSDFPLALAHRSSASTVLLCLEPPTDIEPAHPELWLEDTIARRARTPVPRPRCSRCSSSY